MNSAKLAGRLCSLVDRAVSQLERSMEAIELDTPKAAGIGYIAQQMVQMSQAISYMRKEERETAKTPLDSDKMTHEETIMMLAEVLSTEDLETILNLKKGSK